MHRAAAYLLAIWLLTLSVSGWCCRFPSGDAVVDGPGTAKTHARACCCKQCASRLDLGPRLSTPGCPGRCHDVCRYLPQQKVQVDAPSIADGWFEVILTVGLSEQHVREAADRDESPGFAANALKLRLHLLHQILLV